MTRPGPSSRHSSARSGRSADSAKSAKSANSTRSAYVASARERAATAAHHASVTIDAARIARAECEAVVDRMRRKLRHNGVPAITGLDGACDVFVAVQAAAESEVGEAMRARDSSGDDRFGSVDSRHYGR